LTHNTLPDKTYSDIMILNCKFCKNSFTIEEELSNLDGKLIKCEHCKEEWIHHSPTYFLESRLAELDQDLKKIEVLIDDQNNKHSEQINFLEKDLENKKNELNKQKLLEEKVGAFEHRITDTEKLESVQANLENKIFQLEKDVKKTSEDITGKNISIKKKTNYLEMKINTYKVNTDPKQARAVNDNSEVINIKNLRTQKKNPKDTKKKKSIFSWSKNSDN
jgi:predicted Zn finger-like uncharacterized protein